MRTRSRRGRRREISQLRAAGGQPDSRALLPSRHRQPVDRSEIKLKEELPVIADLSSKAAICGCFASRRGCRALPATCRGSPTAQAIAGLVERFWADVHPKAFEGDFTLRQNVLSGLDDWWQIIQPLQHLPLVRDKRAEPHHFSPGTRSQPGPRKTRRRNGRRFAGDPPGAERGRKPRRIRRLSSRRSPTQPPRLVVDPRNRSSSQFRLRICAEFRQAR